MCYLLKGMFPKLKIVFKIIKYDFCFFFLKGLWRNLPFQLLNLLVLDKFYIFILNLLVIFLLTIIKLW